MQDESDVPGGSLLADMRTPAGAWMDADEIEGPDGVLAEAEAWAPTPIELDNARLHDPASFDIITTLVDIYGDSLFVAEYKCALSTFCSAGCMLPVPQSLSTYRGNVLDAWKSPRKASFQGDLALHDFAESLTIPR